MTDVDATNANHSMSFVAVVVVVVVLSFVVARAADRTRADAINAVAESHATTCLVVVHASEDARRIHRFLKQLTATSRTTKAVVAEDFDAYATRLAHRYDRERCSKMMNVLHGSEERIRPRLEQLSRSGRMGGPIWMTFVGNASDEYLSNVDLDFDANFIVARERGDVVVLDRYHRVSMKHPVRRTPFGTWSPNGGLALSEESVAPWRRDDLEGALFRVSFKESWPLSTVDAGGYFGRVWKDLEGRLNFSTAYVEGDAAIGAWDGERWTGLVGMLLRGEIDAAVADVTITPERLSVVDFLKPLFMTRYQLFFRSPGPEIQWDVILRPFRTEVWFAVAAVLSAVVAFLVAGHRIGLGRDVEDEDCGAEYAASSCTFHVISAFLQQGNSLKPKSVSSRIALFTAYAFSSIIVILYSGTLMSMIAFQKPSRPFDSLESFLADGTYTLEEIPGSDSYGYFSNASDALLREIYEKAFARKPPEELPASRASAIERVCADGKVAHLGEFDLLVVVAARQISDACSVLYLEKMLRLVTLSIAVEKDSPYKDAFDYQLSRMAVFGTLRRLRDASFPLEARPKRIRFAPVRGEQTVHVHLVLATGTLASAVVLLLECAFTNRKRVAAPRGRDSHHHHLRY